VQDELSKARYTPSLKRDVKGATGGHAWPQEHVEQPAITLARTFGPAETASIELLGLQPFDLAPFLFLFLFLFLLLATGDSCQRQQRQQTQHVEVCAGRGVGGSW
jgi:hypothetical protein